MATDPLVPSAGATVPSADVVSALAATIAPLNSEQLAWASGYVAGLAAARQPVAAQAATSPTHGSSETVPKLTIIFGSQTGHSEGVAQALYASAQRAGVDAVLLSMADVTARKLSRERWVALVVSTHGDGDPPDDAILLLEQLRAERAPRLEALRFSILALGDSSYPQFCQTGKDFEAALTALGAQSEAPAVLCDVDYEIQAEQWQASTLETYRKAAGAAASRPNLQVVAAPAPSARRAGEATVLTNQRVTGDRSSKRVHHLELGFDEPLEYAPGDALGVKFANPPAAVTALIEAGSFDPAIQVTVEGQTRTLQQALSETLEITRVSGAFLDSYALLAGVDGLSDALHDDVRRRRLLSTGHIIDVVSEFPHTAHAQAFVNTLRPLQTRLYSIASSPTETPDEIHLLVAQVEFEMNGLPRQGAASSALVGRVTAGDVIDVQVEPNPRFRLPADDGTDVIMIGPGTGVAPFRSFVQERAARDAAGRHWLFFGDRTSDEDFLYQTEWQGHLRSGALDRMDVAFSRDQRDKVYVQDRLRERAQELVAWIDGGAAIYVCGDATHMAPDVHEALIRILAAARGGTREDGVAALDALRRDGRYLRDVY